MRKISVLISVVVAVLVVVGCAGKPEDKILGKWGDNEGTMTFYKDGTMSIKWPGIKDPLIGKYSFVDRNHIKITNDGLWGGVSKISEVSFPTKNELVIHAIEVILQRKNE